LLNLDLAFPIDQYVDFGRLGPDWDASGGIGAQGDSFVFVSYSGADETWATWVASVLGEEGLTARELAWDAPPWEDFVEWMDFQLAGSRWMVALFSQSYVSSFWCSLEWMVALAHGMLLPVRVEPVTLPEGLRTLECVDLFDVDGAQARELLLSAVGV
jgi:hypothetical protein